MTHKLFSFYVRQRQKMAFIHVNSILTYLYAELFSENWFQYFS
jgi:hypothetical protein